MDLKADFEKLEKLQKDAQKQKEFLRVKVREEVKSLISRFDLKPHELFKREVIQKIRERHSEK